MADTSRKGATILPVVLSGGSGVRLWPLSRALHPKQLLALASEQTLLQETLVRVQGAPFAAPVIVCNAEHRFVVAEQGRAAGTVPRAIVLEPQGRNTAPAAAVAALLLVEADPAAMLLVLPSDHVVRDVGAFRAAVETGLPAARAGALVTFGIRPQSAETGFGYIRRGDPWPGAPGCFRAARFVEKPDRTTAEGYVRDGGYDWNSGMFLFAARAYLAELDRLRPGIAPACREALMQGMRDLDFLRLEAGAFAACESVSIDHAVMERTDRAAVVPAAMGWSDIGSWAALWSIGGKDSNGNVAVGDVWLEDVRQSYVRSERPLVAVLGVRDLVIVATQDAILVANREQSQDVKAVVEDLTARGRAECMAHPIVYRPWGHYQTVDVGSGFQVKHIMVKPGHKLSLQLHRRRAEHWVVVAGTARVIRGEETLVLAANQSTYIPVGIRHRLENVGREPLRLIEVQSGDYLGEDDIVRFDDAYGRE